MFLVKWHFVVVILTCGLKITQAEIKDPTNCYMLGTIESIDGELKYKETGACTCYKNVVGRDCEKCKEGHYGILSGRGCKKCLCDPHGSQSTKCNSITGQCSCISGFSGFLCDKCKQNYYRPKPNVCKPCNCNIFGSKDLQCDENGDCLCLPNVTGQKCDQCIKSKFDIKNKCLDCPKCYKNVEQEFNLLTEHLHEIKVVINVTQSIKQNGEAVKENELFLQKLKILKKKIMQLNEEVQNETSLDFDVLTKLYNKLNGIIEEITKLKNQSLITDDVSLFHQKIGRSFEEISKLLVDWKGALKNAMSISETVQQSNTDILEIKNKAVNIVKNMEDILSNIMESAKKANNTCSSAIEQIESFKDKHEGVTLDISDFKKDISKIDITTLETKVKTILANVKLTKETAEVLLSLANELPSTISTPNANVTEERLIHIEKKLNEYQAQNSEIKNNLDKFNATLLHLKNTKSHIDKDLEELEKLLEEAKAVVDDITNLVNEKIKILNAFTKNIEDERRKANRKLKLAGLIRKHINELKDKIQSEHNTLEQNVKLITSVDKLNAINVENVGKNKVEVGKLSREYTTEEKKLVDLSTKVKKGSEEIKEYLHMVKSRIAEVRHQNEELNQLKKKLDEMQSLVEATNFDNLKAEITRMKEITEFVKALPLNDKELNGIERQLRKAENNLKDYKDQKEDLMKYQEFLKEYRYLQKEVEKVKQISRSLKAIQDKCYHTRPIETKPDSKN